MLNYAETASSSTIVPLASLPPSQCQQHTTDHASSVLSYAIGPIDPAQIFPFHAHLSSEEQCTLLIPTQLPLCILNDPAFRNGYEWNYLTEEDDEKEEWTVAQLVNHIYASLTDQRFYRTLDTGEVAPYFLPWWAGCFGTSPALPRQTAHWLLSEWRISAFCFPC